MHGNEIRQLGDGFTCSLCPQTFAAVWGRPGNEAMFYDNQHRTTTNEHLCMMISINSKMLASVSYTVIYMVRVRAGINTI